MAIKGKINNMGWIQEYVDGLKNKSNVTINNDGKTLKINIKDREIFIDENFLVYELNDKKIKKKHKHLKWCKTKDEAFSFVKTILSEDNIDN